MNKNIGVAGRMAGRKALLAKAELTEAIKVMRKFLDDAERDLQRDSETLVHRLNLVSNALVWGNANAQSNIQAAVRLIDESNQHLIEMYSAKEDE